MPLLRITTAEVFWAQGLRAPATSQHGGCLLWAGKVSEQGYGRLGPTLTGSHYAHVSAWILTYGPVPAHLTVDHRCHSEWDTGCTAGPLCLHRRCIDPAHERLLTRAENSALQRGQHSAAPGDCPQGHPRRTLPCGQRYCPACTRTATEAWLDRDGNRARQNAMRAARQ